MRALSRVRSAWCERLPAIARKQSRQMQMQWIWGEENFDFELPGCVPTSNLMSTSAEMHHGVEYFGFQELTAAVAVAEVAKTPFG